MNQINTATKTRHRIGIHQLQAVLSVPEQTIGLVVFAHGSDSSCVSPRNEHIANRLNEDGMATLLFDFLTETECNERDNSFKPELLAGRLQEVLDWTRQQESLEALPLAMFGSGTGMAAVIILAANQPEQIRAIVGRGGRTDLAKRWLDQVKCPALLMVGELDKFVLSVNQAASHAMPGETNLRIIVGASHLFSETGKLDEICEMAASWLLSHFQASSPTSN